MVNSTGNRIASLEGCACRGGLSTKIHLAADRRCRPVTRILTPGRHGDCPQFIPLLNQVRIARRGKGRPHTRLAPRWRTRRTPLRPTALTWAAAVSRRSSRSRTTRRNTAAPAAGPAAGRPPSTPDGTRNATPSNAASASSSSSAPSPPATTNATSCTRCPSTSPRSGSGYATPSDDVGGHDREEQGPASALPACLQVTPADRAPGALNDAESRLPVNFRNPAEGAGDNEPRLRARKLLQGHRSCWIPGVMRCNVKISQARRARRARAGCDESERSRPFGCTGVALEPAGESTAGSASICVTNELC